MTPDDIQKLLGGYATGTLTEVEQQALFEAALHDQTLFDALAREQTLHELLRDPAARAQLLSALDTAPRRWWSWRPVAAVLAMAAIGSFAVVMSRHPRPVLVGQAVPPASPVAELPAAPVPQPLPAAPPRRKPPAGHARPAAPVASEPLPSPALAAEAPKPEAPNKAAEARVEVTAAAPAVPAPAATPRTSMFASENQTGQLARPLAVPVRLPAPSARGIFFGPAPQAHLLVTRTAADVAGAIPVNFAVRYTILRKDASGNFVEAAPADLAPGDTVEIRFTANATGYLTVGESTPVSLTAMAPYTTPPLPAGPSELKVIFAAQPARDGVAAVAPYSEVQNRDTFVASRAPGVPLSFTIKLP